MKNAIKISTALLLLTIMLAGCGGADADLPVSNLSIKSVTEVTSADITKPPVSYSATIEWDIVDILANDVSAAALTGFEAYTSVGSAIEIIDSTLAADVTSFTFTGLEPGESISLGVKAVYDLTALPDAEDSSNVKDSTSFIGGPWFTATSSSVPSSVSRFSVGTFNNLDSMPSSAYTISDVYYFNEYNTAYHFSDIGDTVWFIVDVDEVNDTGSNDTATQRDTIFWLNDDFQLLDKSVSGLGSYDDIASVDITILNINGDELLTITGSTTAATMTSANFTNLVNSVDSGYYADKTGYYFVKAKCTAMPTSYSSSNSNELGVWGFANNGPKR